MGQTLGKQFEQKFYEDFSKIESCSIDRNYDIMLGYKHISSISDYTCYIYPNLYYIECKTIKGNTFPISNLTQLDKLKEKIGIKGIRAGVIIWFYEHENKIVYVPAKTFLLLKDNNKKSFHVNMIGNDEYRNILIPSQKRRFFYDSDYNILKDLKEGD